MIPSHSRILLGKILPKSARPLVNGFYANARGLEQWRQRHSLRGSLDPGGRLLWWVPSKPMQPVLSGKVLGGLKYPCLDPFQGSLEQWRCCKLQRVQVQGFGGTCVQYVLPPRCWAFRWRTWTDTFSGTLGPSPFGAGIEKTGSAGALQFHLLYQSQVIADFVFLH